MKIDLRLVGGVRAGLVSLDVPASSNEGTISEAQYDKDVQLLRTKLQRMTARYMGEINDSPPSRPHPPPPVEVEADRASPGVRGLATSLPQLRTARTMRRSDGTAGPKKSRGAYGHPPLLSEISPRTVISPRVAAAADAFDEGHQRRWDQAEGLLMAVTRDPSHEAKALALSEATEALFRGRYHERIEIEGVKR